MQRLLFYFLLASTLIPSLKTFSSEGSPYLIHFVYNQQTHNQIWSIEQSPRNTILIAKRTGLLEFDSESWQEIKTPDIPLKIHTSESRECVYISGRGYIGQLEINSKGQYIYRSIAHSEIKNKLFNNIFETDSSIFFVSQNLIVEKSKYQKDSLIYASPKGASKFSGVFIFNNTPHVFIKNKGIRALNDSVYLEYNNEFISGEEEIVFYTDLDDNSVILGTNNGNLFSYNGNNLSAYEIEDNNLFQSGIITDGVRLNENTIALSTRNFGVVILDQQSRQIISIIGQDAGLPSNHVMSLFVDNNSGIWVAHSSGLTRIDTKLPVYNYNSYAGLDAGVNAVRFWNDRLYLATTKGVYSLDSISHYDTKEVVRRIPIKSSRIEEVTQLDEPNIEQKMAVTPDVTDSITSIEEQNEKRGFLRKLFGKKKTEAETNVDEKPESIQPKTKKSPAIKKSSPVYQSFSYETFVLTSKSYGYSPLPEITERCKYLFPFQNHLLAITDSKILAISNNKEVEEIFTSDYIFNLSANKTNTNELKVITSEGIYTSSYTNGEWLFTTQTISNINFRITAITQLMEDSYLLAMNNQLVFYSPENDQLKTIEVENPYSERIYLKSVGDQHYVIVGRTFYIVHGLGIEDIKLEPETDFSVILPFLNQPDNFWIKTDKKQFLYYGVNEISDNLLAFLNVFENVNDIHLDTDSNIWVVADYENIYKINSSAFNNYLNDIDLIIKSAEKPSGEYVDLDNLNLSYFENALRFTVYTPTYLQNNSNQYQYIIEGLTTEWSKWSSDNVINVPYLPSGKFTLKVRARDILGNISEIKSVGFKISPPFWETPYFFVGLILTLIFLIYLLQQYRMKKLVKEKKVLSEKVKERTIELELKNKAITDSINYAGKMQSALLPSEEIINEYLAENFIFFKPRNIVSGDFFWATQKNKYTIVAAADCTGHGVPGAFMSMLGMALMSEIVNKTTIYVDALFINLVRNKIIQLLTAKYSEAKDGMDIALLIFNKENQTLQYAGAHNPLYRLVSRKNELTEDEKSFVSKESDKHYLMHYKADRFHVGKSNYSEVKFTNHTIKYNPDDTFYIFSDGYPDQFGGPEERKFMYGPFKKLFLEIVDLPMEEQSKILEKRISEWMDNYEQTDDMLIFGIRP